MEKTKNRKKIIAVLTIALAMVMVLSCVIGVFGDSINIPKYVEESDFNVSNTAIPVTKNSDDNLGEFEDGLAYIYTAKNLVDSFRTSSAPYDITTHKVAKTDANRGSQENPYVISSTADWETFVKLVAEDGTHGRNSYYVLSCDIDFSTVVDFHPVTEFNGTFYGLGHTLSGITCSSWKYWNTSVTPNAYTDIGTSGYTKDAYGLFCYTSSGATVTDLIVTDYNYSNMSSGKNTVQITRLKFAVFWAWQFDRNKL